ncbi:MAG: STAS domain-containing protein [Gammaproteobacteria bacterium]|uniref:STAS domain-containing protein n=1 Tax=Rhodoferax sp. TaxID=50421 RepID=UPI0017B6649C|nr:STAS domain-containing protein [Rhodoferax sp.]MBU3897730.1 STAS domain-containing protein [Gammaproteobacteria bacterium]MBA3057821.1 STAS domain-containing protein [Rhodoferax sp.]MBU3998775.1 STAS domain-containing protein [Gammaproteobacteria bacterium]MBU4081573.1 STAS domain-containing protein [Gammaproteobacteria bacterium]MBU4114090.1 STAS domain-containing protein [Gammaproteobacteria bacterium]
MATKDTNTGLLSKMARFVRNPTKDWSELDAPEPDAEQENEYGKAALKEMIERKRQNDFVRRREFDHLRKIRRNEPVPSPELAGRPSFFQTSSISNLDERATTLKKIDEIEAQMSKQWWKGKQDEALVRAGHPTGVDSVAPAADTTVPQKLSKSKTADTFNSTTVSELSPAEDSASGLEYEPTQMGLAASQEPLSFGAPRQMLPPRNSAGRSADAGLSEFSTSKLFSVELGDRLADPDLEEAAIRFANGDDAGAEATLLTALQAAQVDADAADGWAAALFDLYRSTGQQASFDRVAIEYAQRYGRSAPAWFSTPELLGHHSRPAALPQGAAPASGQQLVWDCPVDLDKAAVQALRASLAAAPGRLWHLRWSQCQGITLDAAPALAALFHQWCAQPVKLQFDGSEVLHNTLKSFTPSGDQAVDKVWWRLRLDALRIMRLQDEFELTALDYCVTYEVSPPPWEDAQCEYVQERFSPTLPGETMVGALGAVSTIPAFAVSQSATVPMGLDPLLTATVVELNGEVLGDAAEALDTLQAGLHDAKRLVISCARLIRVDFSAAGSILNWVAQRESEGCSVQFRDVPRLVAAFFSVIGINEHARVVLRTS